MKLLPLVLGLIWLGGWEWLRGRPRWAQQGTVYMSLVGWLGLAVGLGLTIALLVRPN